jgi:hypothetical protein
LESVYEISESISFGGSVKLTYLLYTAEIDTIPTELKDNIIAIGLPLAEATEWITSEQVGIEHTISFSNGTDLLVLIEKDFPCKDTPIEEQKDTFIELVPPDREVC